MTLKHILPCILLVLLSACNSTKKTTKNTPIVTPRVKESVIIFEEEDNTSSTPNTNTTSPSTKPIISSSTLNKTELYIQNYKEIAIEEMQQYKIPASITLAQGILESGSGHSELSSKSNNHFGIKCHKGWKGERVYHDDDAKGECFRKYKHPSYSFRDHSLFLSERQRYFHLFKLEPTDYKGWAKGLQKAGYATDRKYPAKLISLIERYNLHLYDLEVLGENHHITSKKHVVKKGDTLYSISRKYNIPVGEIKRINGLEDNNISIGQSLFLADLNTNE